MATQVQIARKLGLDVSTVNKILHNVPGLKWRPETVEAVFDAAEELGYNLDRIKYRHNREYVRYPADSGVAFEIELPGRGVVERGQGRIRDISQGGVRLSDVQLPSGTIPAGPFKVVLRSKVFQALRRPARGQLVRYHQNGSIDFCLRFDAPVDGATVKAVRRATGK